jgi:hypothetical protein
MPFTGLVRPKSARWVATLALVFAFSACSSDSPSTPSGSAGTGNIAGGGAGGLPGGTGGSGGSGVAGTSNGSAGSSGAVNVAGGGAGGVSASAGSGGAAGSAGSGGSAGAAAGAGGACNPSTGKALLFDGDAVDLVKSFCLEGTGDTPDCSQPDPAVTDLPITRTSRTVELWAWFSGPKAWRGEHSLWEYGKGQPCHVFGVDVEHYNDNDSELDPYGNGCGADNTLKLVPTVPEMGWLHIAWAYDGPNNTFQFTVNGLKQPIPSLMAMQAWTTTQSPLTIGAASEFGLDGFDGKIDELRVWNISRSVDDIARDMKVILKGNEPGLVAYYHFDEGQGTTSVDATGKKGHRAYMISDVKPQWVDSDIPGPFTCAP